MRDHSLENYVGDFTNREVLYAAFLRSTYPHAKILRIDVPQSVKQKSKLVLTAKEVSDLTNEIGPTTSLRPIGQAPWRVPILPKHKTTYFGQPLAMVVAKDPYICADLIEEFVVEYEPLTPVIQPEEAMSDKILVLESYGSNIASSISFSQGNPSTKGNLTVDVELRIERQVAAPIETRGCFVYPDDEKIVAVIPTKMPFETRRIICEALRLRSEQIKIVVPRIGGSFGSKGPAYPEEILVCLASKLLKLPVFWSATRTEETITSNHARDSVLKAKAEFLKNGKFIALNADILIDCGAPWVSNLGALLRGTRLLTGCYKVPNLQVNATSVFTNKTPAGPVRGNGRPEAILLIERVMNEAATELNIDPLELRRINLITQSDLPYDNGLGVKIVDCDFETLLSVFKSKYERIVAQTQDVGIGMALYLEDTGGQGIEGAKVILNPSGELDVYVGAVFYGQNITPVVQKIVRSTLGISNDHIVVKFADTDALKNGVGSFGSRTTVMTGSAVLLACENLVKKIAQFCSKLWDSRVDSIKLQDGFVYDDKGNKAHIFEISKCYFEKTGEILSEEVVYSGNETTYSYGAHLAIVRIDQETGEVRVIKYFALDDVGNLFSEEEVHGQLIGGIVHAFSNAFFERMVYTKEGIPISTNFSNYLIASAVESFDVQTEFYNTQAKTNPLGARGVGEGGTIGGLAALVNALHDVLKKHKIKLKKIPWSGEFIVKSWDES